MSPITGRREIASGLAFWLLLMVTLAPRASAEGFKLYAVFNNSAELSTVDPVTGGALSSVVMTLPGKTVGSATGLARNPVAGDLYVLLNLQSQGPSELAMVDPATGLCADIGPADDGSGQLRFAGITFASDGTLYGVTSGSSPALPRSLFLINRATGQGTLLRELGGDGGHALAFNATNGLLYHASGNVFESVNPAFPAGPPTNIPLSGYGSTVVSPRYSATALVHWTGDFFLWASKGPDWPAGYVWLVTADGRVRYLVDLRQGEDDAVVSGLALVGSAPSCPQALYGTAHSGPNAPDIFFAIDPSTGAADMIGPVGFERVSALDFGNNGTLYAAGERIDGSNTMVLLTIDHCTGAGTELGPIGRSPVPDMSSRSTDGTLFAYSAGDLITLDANTGAATVVGSTGVSSGGNGLSFNLAGDSLYHAAYFGPGSQLFSIDAATAASTLLAPLALPPPDGALNAMDADPSSGTLFASFVDNDFFNYLATVNPSTGDVTILGATQPGLDSLAFSSGTPPAQFTLTVLSSGSGSGTVTGDVGGIDCGAICSALFDPGSVVHLTATPAPEGVFGGWSGACSGTGDCVVTMAADRTVTATFKPPQFSLFVEVFGTGSGTVTSSPAGIACATACGASFDEGSTVTLTATPDEGSVFTGWGCTGAGGCTMTVTMDDDHEVSAVFDLAPPTQFSLGVSRTGSGSGTVTSSPAGIDCGATCGASFDAATTVTLTATPVQGSVFTGWSGDCSGAGGCSVTMDGNHAVSVGFDPVPDFSLGSPPAPQTVSAGQAAQFVLTINGQGGFNGSVSFACTAGVPPLAACSFSPPTVTPGAGPVTTTLTITTAAASVARLHDRGRHDGQWLWATSLPLMGLVLVPWGVPKKRLPGTLGLAVLMLAALLVMAGCGGSSASTSPPPQAGTPAGSYVVTVTATSGSVSHTQTVNLAVN